MQCIIKSIHNLHNEDSSLTLISVVSCSSKCLQVVEPLETLSDSPLILISVVSFSSKCLQVAEPLETLSNSISAIATEDEKCTPSSVDCLSKFARMKKIYPSKAHEIN